MNGVARTHFRRLNGALVGQISRAHGRILAVQFAASVEVAAEKGLEIHPGARPGRRGPRRPGRLEIAGDGKTPAMSNIIGRPNDDLLDVMLGHGSDPEQAFIGGSQHGQEEGDDLENRPMGHEPTVPAT